MATGGADGIGQPVVVEKIGFLDRSVLRSIFSCLTVQFGYRVLKGNGRALFRLCYPVRVEYQHISLL